MQIYRINELEATTKKHSLCPEEREKGSQGTKWSPNQFTGKNDNNQLANGTFPFLLKCTVICTTKVDSKCISFSISLFERI